MCMYVCVCVSVCVCWGWDYCLVCSSCLVLCESPDFCGVTGSALPACHFDFYAQASLCSTGSVISFYSASVKI